MDHFYILLLDGPFKLYITCLSYYMEFGSFMQCLKMIITKDALMPTWTMF